MHNTIGKLRRGGENISEQRRRNKKNENVKNKKRYFLAISWSDSREGELTGSARGWEASEATARFLTSSILSNNSNNLLSTFGSSSYLFYLLLLLFSSWLITNSYCIPLCLLISIGVAIFLITLTFHVWWI